jgi:hypothetical protein
MRVHLKHGATLDTVTPDEMRALLQENRDAGSHGGGYTGIFDVIAGDFKGPESVLLSNPPVRRLRITKKCHGFESLAITNVGDPVQIAESNEGRLGGQVVNTGANPCYIYPAPANDLAGMPVGNRPGMWLSASGGSWDFTISDIVWGGSVCALSITGATTLSMVEI